MNSVVTSRVGLWFAMVGALAVGVEACRPPDCTATTCPAGCCDSFGECQSGVLHGACGREGASCSVCAAGEVCSMHSCQVRQVVDAGTPDGGVRCGCTTGCCRDDGTCSPGNLVEACGLVSKACVSCGSGQRCDQFRCTSAVCAGCVDAVGSCQLGTADTTCGGDGGLCVTCLPSERCVNRRCQALVCNAATCPGCCVGTTCTTPSAASCGIGGIACVPCTGNQSCLNGVCQ